MDLTAFEDIVVGAGPSPLVWATESGSDWQTVFDSPAAATSSSGHFRRRSRAILIGFDLHRPSLTTSAPVLQISVTQ